MLHCLHVLRFKERASDDARLCFCKWIKVEFRIGAKYTRILWKRGARYRGTLWCPNALPRFMLKHEMLTGNATRRSIKCVIMLHFDPRTVLIWNANPFQYPLHDPSRDSCNATAPLAATSSTSVVPSIYVRRIDEQQVETTYKYAIALLFNFEKEDITFSHFVKKASTLLNNLSSASRN